MTNAPKQKRRPVMLAILDGWGWREDAADNAIRQASTPTFDRLWEAGPHAFLRTSGKDVGLPDDQMGNSEVGHLNIGAGRVVMQDLPRITDAIATGEIKWSPALTELIAALKGAAAPVISSAWFRRRGAFAPGTRRSARSMLAAADVPAVVHALTDGPRHAAAIRG